MGKILNRTFYTVKPIIPRAVQLSIRRQIAKYKRKKYSNIWPIDPDSATPPDGWKGWPEGKQFAVVLSHDVDTRYGYENCLKLADLEESLGFRSCFNFVPERYGEVSLTVVNELKSRGFAVGVHGLKHDGKLFWSEKIFKSRAQKINEYITKWGTTGFTSPAMHHNHRWMGDLKIDYSTSMFDTDPFEPQPDGVRTIFPLWVELQPPDIGFTELPYTLPQDSTLFVILKEKDINIWLRKLNWIANRGGMAILNTHPDYMNLDGMPLGNEKYPVEHYKNFLEHLNSRYMGQFYHELPAEIARLWKKFALKRISTISDLNCNTNFAKNSKLSIARSSSNLHGYFNGIFSMPYNQTDEDSIELNSKKHILFIVENSSVPPDIRVWREAKAAKRFGFNVSVICPTNKKYTKKIECIDDIFIYRHFSYKHKGGILHQAIEYSNAFLWESYLSFKLYLKRPFHIIHSANPPDNVFIIALFYKLFRVKFIYDHHDLAPELYKSKFKNYKKYIFDALSLFEKLSCKTADAIISTNASYRRHVVEKHRVKKCKLRIVRNDPNLSTFKRENTCKPKDKCVKLVYVGSINVQDGVENLIKILNILVHELNYIQLKCSVLGDGEALDQVKALTEDLKLCEHVEFTGFIYDRNIVRNYIENAHICVEPAPDNEANRHSTFIKIMEYMACSKPIVAFDLEETRQSVGDTAILVKPMHLWEFAVAIATVIDNPELGSKIGGKARKRIENGMNWENACAELLKVYSSLIGRPQ